MKITDIIHKFFRSVENVRMLYYDRIDFSEGIDVNKASASKESDVCHYWYFFNYSFKF